MICCYIDMLNASLAASSIIQTLQETAFEITWKVNISHDDTPRRDAFQPVSLGDLCLGHKAII